MNAGKLTVVLGYAIIGTALCASTMMLGMATMPVVQPLIIHVLAVPVVFVFVSLFYFNRYAYTTPLQTALVFVSVAVLVNFFVVGLIFNRSLDLFANPLGTWIPLFLIFAVTHLTGLIVTASTRRRIPAH